MKQYPYSVKKALNDCFGENEIAAMRIPHDSWHEAERRKDLLALCWQYADEQAQGICLEEYYLLETALEDDYIAYIIQRGTKKQAWLMFMHTEDEPPFHIDEAYAEQLNREWQTYGYEVLILRVCVWVSDKPGRFHLGTHSGQGKGCEFLKVKRLGNKSVLVTDSLPCWPAYNRKLAYVAASDDIHEYECLFAPDVRVTRGEEKNRTVVATGLEAVKKYFSASSPVQVAYARERTRQPYTQTVLCRDTFLTIRVNRLNLICEITESESQKSNYEILVDDSKEECGSLIAQIPVLNSVRALNPVQMHGFAVQLSYADGTIRNHYLNSFEERQIPESCVIDGFSFTEEQLKTVAFDQNNGICFDNGYAVAGHILYYRSYRQLQVEHPNTVLYSKDAVTIKSIYWLPLLHRMNWFSIRQYWGFPEECYGPAQAFLDASGNRISDISLYCVNKGAYNAVAPCVCVEPSGRYGFLKDDGTWLAPPIYTSATGFQEGCAKVKRLIDEREMVFLLTKEGKEVPFSHEIDVEYFTNDRCAFNAKAWEGDWPDAGYYCDSDWVKPGTWGFIDSNGDIVIQPKYVYAAGFYDGGEEHSVVARFVNGVLRWGVIDRYGNETIPCGYRGVYCRWSEAVAFQRDGSELYGLMDFDGTVIAEPQFGYIEEYDKEHRLIAAGDHEDALGVFSLDQGCFITPEEYDCIDYGEHMIRCEDARTIKDRYFDYNGKELVFNGYDRVCESGGYLNVWKDGKRGVINWDGTVIIPPVLVGGLDPHIEYYKKGLVITEKRKLRGLATTSGKMILPEAFTEVRLHNDMIIGSERTSTNWCIKDTLFSADGKQMLQGPYRRMTMNDKANTLTVETPLGLEHLQILRADKNEDAE